MKTHQKHILKFMQRFISFFAGFLVAWLVLGWLSSVYANQPLEKGQQADEIEGQVVYIWDGDTIDLRDAYGTKHRIRLSEIDAPESDQVHGDESKRALEKRIGGQKVLVKVQKEKERYGRLVGHIYREGENINYWMVESGNAWQYKRYSKSQELAALEQKAREKRLGLWENRNPIAPWNYRHGAR